MKRDPRETERALIEIAREQDGYFTAAQALSVGYTYRQQNHHKNRGNWLHIDHGVFRLRGYPDSEHEDLIRWSLWSRNRRGEFQATVSHETALALHELGDVMPAKTHLTVPPGFRKKAPGGCILHKAYLGPGDIERRRGFNVTTPIRTLLDIANSPVSQDLLEGAVRDALVRGVVRSKQLFPDELSKEARAKLQAAVEAVEGVEAT
jgi:predicted transcriptional regulator of viral defense system